MRDATPDVQERLEFAARIAREAGARVMRYYGETGHVTKEGGSPVTRADLESNAYLVSAIREAWPGEAVLAEESVDSEERLGADRLWLVDPLDGTKEFLARNGEFSVMIGFAEGGAPTVGVVYVPAHGLLYGAARGRGAWVEPDGGSRRTLRCAVASGRSLRLVSSRSHPDELLERLRLELGVVDVRLSGSVGIKCALIAEGQSDLYIHPVPYLKEWDTCAPSVLVTESGGVVTDCLGEPLQYNKRLPGQPDGMVASGADVHDEVLARIRPLYEAVRRERAGRGGDHGTERSL